MHGNSPSLAGWSDAAYGDLSQNGKCRLGYLIGIMSSSLTGPCHVLQWTSKFTRKPVKSSLGGEAYAFSEMIDHVALLREFPFVVFGPSTLGLEYCGNLSTRPRGEATITEKCLARHFSGIQQVLRTGELDNISWLPGTGNPGGGLTEVKIEMVPLLRMLQSGAFCPGAIRPMRGAPPTRQ